MTSHAYINRASLPGRTSTLDISEPSKRAFNAGKDTPEKGRATAINTDLLY